MRYFRIMEALSFAAVQQEIIIRRSKLVCELSGNGSCCCLLSCGKVPLLVHSSFLDQLCSQAKSLCKKFANINVFDNGWNLSEKTSGLN